ncbi:hypothetical protein LGV61_02865 [Desulfurispirillum indicum]|uniref:DUF3311 domain-containing protein n=1 Tax=Desulfurispirillum indicum (strain ATCC BAA-1389 / DSM 22839 / S5) TaxID=653733 RepID=E6W111_DESIS|nr:hypothetical protein [Desulfurispirillum indicum]ADU65343.1 hypothetical protein Selin_0595 [Desulfurispirillum indicum S5]UCZ57239.1 hypothetical protein LGV61_02865 [Desulfurispirillum indicum]
MKHQRFSPLAEAWILFFLLGVLMINYPFTHIFNKLTLVLGVPMMVLYFLLGWPLSIAVIYFFTRSLNHGDAESADHEDRDQGES